MGHHSFSRFVLLVITAVVQLLLLSTHVRAQYDYSTLAASSDSNAGAYSYSGAAIATSGTVVAIGAPQADIHGVTTDTSIYGTGFVLLYNCPLTSGQYVCGTPSYYDDSAYSGSSDSLYGFSVALINNGQILIVGAPDYSGSHGEGVVFFYNCPAITSCALAYDVGDYVMGVSLAAAMTCSTPCLEMEMLTLPSLSSAPPAARLPPLPRGHVGSPTSSRPIPWLTLAPSWR